jgi:hypothetical protein
MQVPSQMPSNSFVRCILGVLLLGSTIGCATNLRITETSDESPTPSGVLVNKQKTYAVSMQSTPNSPLSLTNVSQKERTLNGVDRTRLLQIDYSRMLFASGSLEVELSKQQVPRKLGIKSSPGLAGGLAATETIVTTSSKIHDLNTPTTTLP